MERADVSFPSGDDRCAAWLYRPPGEEPLPCVVMAAGFGGVREMRLDAYAERFAAAGLAALVFDYRHWGASDGQPRQLVDIGRQLADWRAAIAFARALDDTDPDRVALWGTSFSGGHVIETATADPGIAAAVAQSPFVDGRDTLRVLGAWGLVRGLPSILRDELRGRRGRPPFYRPISGPPGALAALTTPDAEEGIRSLVPPGAPWRNAHTPRVGLRVGAYRPGRAAPRVRCPLLLCVCEHDLLTPADRAIRVARSAPRGEARVYPIGHFEIYFGDWFERAVSDQTEFLRHNLIGDGSAGGRAAGDAATEGSREGARGETTTALPSQ